MDGKGVIEAVRIIRDECNLTSCFDCCFNKDGDCELTNVLNNDFPNVLEVENLEECIND